MTPRARPRVNGRPRRRSPRSSRRRPPARPQEKTSPGAKGDEESDRAEAALATARARSIELIAAGEYREAKDAVRSVAKRFGETPWMAERGRRLVDGTLKRIDEAHATAVAATLDDASDALDRGAYDVVRRTLSTARRWPQRERDRAAALLEELDRRLAAAEEKKRVAAAWTEFHVKLAECGKRGLAEAEKCLAAERADLEKLGAAALVDIVRRRLEDARRVEEQALDTFRNATRAVRVTWGRRPVTGTVVRVDGGALALKPIIGGVVAIPVDEIAPRDMADAAGLLTGGRRESLRAAAYYLARGEVLLAGAAVGQLDGERADAIRREAEELAAAMSLREAEARRSAPAKEDVAAAPEPAPERARADEIVKATPGCIVWYDASDAETLTRDAGGRVSAWNDKSGGGHHATQASDGQRPTWVAHAHGALPGVSFEGSKCHLTAKDAGHDFAKRGYSLFVVKKRDPSKYATLLSSQDFQLSTGMVRFKKGGSKGYAGDVPAHSVISIVHGDEVAAYANGLSLGSKRVGPGGIESRSLRLGLNMSGIGGTDRLGGVLFEVIAYARALDDAERRAVEAYLMEKWLGEAPPAPVVAKVEPKRDSAPPKAKSTSKPGGPAKPKPTTARKRAPARAPARKRLRQLTVNPSFEEMQKGTRFAFGWRPYCWGSSDNRYSARIDRVYGHEGEQSLAVRGHAEGGRPGAFCVFAVDAGEYEVSYWACADVAEKAQVQAHLAGVDLKIETVGDEWQRFTQRVTIEKRQLTGGVKVWTTTPGVRVWFDDVEVWKVE